MYKILIPLKWIYKQTYKYRLVIIAILISNLISLFISFYIAVFSKDLVDNLLVARWRDAIDTGAIFLIILFIQIALNLLKKVLTAWNLESMSNKLKTSLFKHLTMSSWLDYKKFHTGDILTRITSDTNMVSESIIKDIPDIISQGVSLVVAFIILISYDPVLALFGIIAGPLLLLVGLLFSTRFINIYAYAQEAESNFRSYAQESLEHMLVIKTFCYEKESQNKWVSLLKKKMKLALKKKAAIGISGLFVVFICGILYMPIVIKVIRELTQGIITYGDLATYIQLIVLIQGPLFNLTNSIQGFTSITASINRIKELVELKVEPSKPNQSLTLYQTHKYNIHFNQVNFFYQKDMMVLCNINRKINQGDRIGLTGKSGEGKTTLIHLLMQILTPSSGEMVLQEDKGEEGVTNTGKNAFIREYTSYVPQGNTLFSGTISQNLLLGKPDATVEEQITALQKAYAWEFVNKTEKGLNTIIGERGMGLSEGQAQRIAIARALLRRAPILILDEATSALDQETEKLVLEEIMQDKTRSIIMITHRASILSYCTRVWKLHKGILTEEGLDINEVAATKVT